MGKYDKVLKDLDPLPVTDLPYQAKVDELKASIVEAERPDAEALVGLYRTMRKGVNPRASFDDIVEALKPLEESERRLALLQLFGKEGLKALLYDCELRVEALEQLIAESEEQGQPGWGAYGARPNALRLKDGATVRVQEEPSAKVENPEAFRLWCIRNGYENALRLWPSTTEAITRERLIRGEPEPDGVRAYRWKKIVLSDGRGGNGADE